MTSLACCHSSFEMALRRLCVAPLSTKAVIEESTEQIRMSLKCNVFIAGRVFSGEVSSEIVPGVGCTTCCAAWISASSVQGVPATVGTSVVEVEDTVVPKVAIVLWLEEDVVDPPPLSP